MRGNKLRTATFLLLSRSRVLLLGKGSIEGRDKSQKDFFALLSNALLSQKLDLFLNCTKLFPISSNKFETT